MATGNTLLNLFEQAPCLTPQDQERFVIFSDLHLGNGGKKDDFKRNAALFSTVLEQYYLRQRYHLILNGDIEELQKFRLPAIRRAWKEVYDLFHRFREETGFYKIVGNHDMTLYLHVPRYEFPLHDALRLETAAGTLFLLHGHQASRLYSTYNDFVGFLLRYFAYPLGIKNVTAAHDSLRRYKIENTIYNFAKTNKIVSIIGHTHRPLFESLSKIDYLKFNIENLCRSYPHMGGERKRGAEEKIQRYKQELDRLDAKKADIDHHGSLYNTNLLVPCLFNAGCVIGKRGITAVEVTGEEIALVHWFDDTISKKHLTENGHAPMKLEGTTFYRKVLKQDLLSYIFTRIRLLA